MSPQKTPQDAPPLASRFLIWTQAHSRFERFAPWLAEACGAGELLQAPFAAGGRWRSIASAKGGDSARQKIEADLNDVLAAGRAFVHPVDDLDMPFHGLLIEAASKAGYRHLLLGERDPTHRLLAGAGPFPSGNELRSGPLQGTMAPSTEVKAFVTKLVVQARHTNRLLAQVRQHLKMRTRYRRTETYEGLFAPDEQAAERNKRWADLCEFMDIPAVPEEQLAELIARLRSDAAPVAPETDSASRCLDELRRELQWIPTFDTPIAFLRPVVQAHLAPQGIARAFRLAGLAPIVDEKAPIAIAGAALVAEPGSAETRTLAVGRAGAESPTPLEWPLPSPGLARQFPKHPDAARCRFRGPTLHAGADERWTFVSSLAQGAAEPVADVRFEPFPTRKAMGIFLARWSIGYQDIPKVACTSIKEALFLLATGTVPTKTMFAGAAHVHDYFFRRSADFSGARFKFLVVRDPIKRFLSGYSNRVRHHGELSEGYIKRHGLDSRIEMKNFIFDPTPEQFVERLEVYMQVPTIRHHFRPIVTFVLPFATFDRIYPFESLDRMCKDITRIAHRPFVLPHSQKAGPKIDVQSLSAAALQRLKKFYAADYELLHEYYTPDAHKV